MKTQPDSEYALLGALMTGPRHGYEIRTFLKQHLGVIWRIPTSQLYARLKRLEENGLVSSSLEAQASRPSKRVFQLTEPGRDGFLAWVLAPTEHVRDLRVEFLAKLFFIRELGLDGTRLVREQDRVLEQALSRMGRRVERETAPHRRLSAGFKRATTQAWRDWLWEEAQPYLEETNQP